MVCFFFFQRDTHTSACKLFHAALPLETSEETEHSPREYDKQRRETKKKKNCKVMVITCAIVCIHNMYACEGGQHFSIAGKAVIPRSSWLYSEKSFSLPTAIAVGGRDVAV